MHCLSNTKEVFNSKEKDIGLFVVFGEAQVNGQPLGVNDLLVVADASTIQLELKQGTRLVILGGEPHPEPRHIWWNFVSSNKDKIKIAAQNWRDQKFGRVEGETDFIPLPDTPLP